MTVTGRIITGLIIALKEGAENAQHTADIIIKAEKTKDEVRSR